MFVPNHQILNNENHKNLCVNTRYNLALEPSVSYARVFLSEFRDIQNHYPILFHKTEKNNTFDPIALFGFSPEENLFLDNDGWHATYVPLSVQRKPFLIGFQEQEIEGKKVETPMVFVDMDNPRVSDKSDTTATPVFLPEGGQSEYLKHINSVLIAVHDGHQQQIDFVSTLEKLSLLKRVTINAAHKDGSQHEIDTLYGIDEEKLYELPADVLHELHQKRYLQAMYICLGSIANLNKLIALKNKRHT